MVILCVLCSQRQMRYKKTCKCCPENHQNRAIIKRFDYRNNQYKMVNIDGKSEKIYVPFAMLTGMLLDEFRDNVGKFLHDFRSFQPETPLWWITPFWISPKWKQKTIRYDLDEYRKIIAEEMAGRNDPNLHVVNGLELLDADPWYFDAVPLHPADAGCEQIAERLAERLMDES